MCVRFSQLDGARIGVWGAGREIASLADQLARRLPTARIVAAAFDAPPSELALASLRSPEVRVLGVEQAVAGLRDCDVVVRSPGVSIHRPELIALREAGVAVTTATALWLAEHGGGGVVGVTGTKGKSTTAALTLQLARGAGRTAALAGNIGAPALDLLDGEPSEVVVLELSSYQIADLASGPEVAVVTNLFREHTDWHGSEEAYAADKLRLLELPGVRVAVLNARDERLAALVPGIEVVRYGSPDGWDASAAGVSFAGEAVIAADTLALPGEHNALNVCAALAALEALGVAVADPGSTLAGFAPLPHRLQSIGEREGVMWVDDSISTTPESALAALASFRGRRVVLIGGGQDRGQDYGALAGALAAHGASVIGVPSTGPRLVDAARAAGVAEEDALQAGDLMAAVELARRLASAGDVVLLSPAAPSYDHYRDFEQRGDLFAALAAGEPPPD